MRRGLLFGLVFSLLIWALIYLAIFHPGKPHPGTLDPILNHQGPMSP